MVPFQVSVVIPVYNAASYVEQAVESAIILSEVGEIILVEDGSPDNALEICRELEKKYPRVQLYQHPEGANKGAGPSRNLGIQKARFPFISFLDADDWYLPNRFKKDAEILKNSLVEGVYNASAYAIDSEYAYNQIKNRYKTSDPQNYLYSVRETIVPADLFYYLLNGGKGHFHTTGITLKREVFEKVGDFKDLKLHQDNHMFLRVASKCYLVGGELDEPTSKIRVHVNNRIKNVNRESRMKYYTSLYTDVYASLENKRDRTTVIKKLIAAKTYHIKNKAVRTLAIIYHSLIHFILHPGNLKDLDLKHYLK